MEAVERRQEVEGGSEDLVLPEQLDKQGLEGPLRHVEKVKWNKHGP